MNETGSKINDKNPLLTEELFVTQNFRPYHGTNMSTGYPKQSTNEIEISPQYLMETRRNSDGRVENESDITSGSGNYFIPCAESSNISKRKSKLTIKTVNMNNENQVGYLNNFKFPC